MPGAYTDHLITAEPSHWDRKPFQVRWSYRWRGEPLSVINYYASKASAERGADRLRRRLSRVVERRP